MGWVPVPPKPTNDGWMLYKPPRRANDGWVQIKPKRGKRKTKTIKVKIGSGQTGVVVDSDTGGAGDLESQANRLADEQIGFSRSEILRQQAAAAARAQRDVSTLSGLGEAQMGMISQIPSQIQTIRNNAAAAMGNVGAAITGAEKSQLSGEQAAAAAFEAGQTGAAPAPVIDPSTVAAATGALAQAPAVEQSEIGAASAIAAAGMPAVVARATQEQVAHRLQEAAMEDGQYRQQLVDLAASRGGVYMDALSGLYDIESKRFGEWEARQRLQLDQRQLALQERAQRANEKIAGIKADQDTRSLDIRESELRLASQKEANDLKEAMAKGAKPNASLSKVYGYVVDANGNAILNARGQRIPVAKSGKSTQSTKAANMQKATKDAATQKGKGKPVVASRGRGQYVTADRYKGVHGPNMYPDGTTDNPDYARYSGRMSFQQVINYLMQTYGLTKAEARKAAKAAGW